MKIINLENAPQEVLDMMGKCEVCGEQASVFVRDIFEIIYFGKPWIDDIKGGELHRYCARHEKPSKIIQLREGPLMYMARAEGHNE